MMLRTFGDDTADFVWAWGIIPPNLALPRGAQATGLFEKMERILAEHGMTFANVVRTWFYNDRINDWYEEFNAARTKFFESRKVFETFLPASTGIGHENPFGAALVSGFFAMRAKDPSAGAEIVKSPLQTDAMTYRSSFSRAAETHSASGRRLFVSGTASLLPNSTAVAYPGDCDRQVDCALRAALTIVTSRGMTIKDITRAIIYPKTQESLVAWNRWLKEHDLPDSFASVMTAEVCRPEWLFEIELDACTRGPAPRL